MNHTSANDVARPKRRSEIAAVRATRRALAGWSRELTLLCLALVASAGSQLNARHQQQNVLRAGVVVTEALFLPDGRGGHAGASSKKPAQFSGLVLTDAKGRYLSLGTDRRGSTAIVLGSSKRTVSILAAGAEREDVGITLEDNDSASRLTFVAFGDTGRSSLAFESKSRSRIRFTSSQDGNASCGLCDRNARSCLSIVRSTKGSAVALVDEWHSFRAAFGVLPSELAHFSWYDDRFRTRIEIAEAASGSPYVRLVAPDRRASRKLE
jgi:hypothetical protein